MLTKIYKIKNIINYENYTLEKENVKLITLLSVFVW